MILDQIALHLVPLPLLISKLVITQSKINQLINPTTNRLLVHQSVSERVSQSFLTCQQLTVLLLSSMQAVRPLSPLRLKHKEIERNILT